MIVNVYNAADAIKGAPLKLGTKPIQVGDIVYVCGYPKILHTAESGATIVDKPTLSKGHVVRTSPSMLTAFADYSAGMNFRITPQFPPTLL